MTVKGQEFPAYDPRGIQGMGLAYATANRGACHLRAYTVASEILGIPEKTDPLVTEGKAELVKAFQDATAAVDSSGLCVFTTFAWGMDDIAPQVDAACEGDWTAEKMLEVGERVWNLERDFNLKAGPHPRRRHPAAPAVGEGANTGPAEGKVNELQEMLPQYYEVRGWTENGELSDDTRPACGSDDVVPPGPLRPGGVSLMRAAVCRAGLEECHMHHIIIGAGPTGGRGRRNAAQAGRRSQITIIGDEPEAPYSRMAIPYLLIDQIDAAGTHLRKGAGHYADRNIEVRQDRVTGVQPDRKSLSLQSGDDVSYDRLLIATGSRPVSPPVPGIDAPGVHACWTLQDARDIMQRAQTGAGWC